MSRTPLAGKNITFDMELFFPKLWVDIFVCLCVGHLRLAFCGNLWVKDRKAISDRLLRVALDCCSDIYSRNRL